jgi:hypothetical protein
MYRKPVFRLPPKVWAMVTLLALAFWAVLIGAAVWTADTLERFGNP